MAEHLTAYIKGIREWPVKRVYRTTYTPPANERVVVRSGGNQLYEVVRIVIESEEKRQPVQTVYGFKLRKDGAPFKGGTVRVVYNAKLVSITGRQS